MIRQSVRGLAKDHTPFQQFRRRSDAKPVRVLADRVLSVLLGRYRLMPRASTSPPANSKQVIDII
jgi:hypothetical protein